MDNINIPSKIGNFDYGQLLRSKEDLNEKVVKGFNDIVDVLSSIKTTIGSYDETSQQGSGILGTLGKLQNDIKKLQPEAITIYQLYLDTHSLVFKHNPETGELTPSEQTVTVSCKKTQGDTTNIIPIPDNLKCKYGYDSTLYDLESDKIKVNSDSISSHSHLYIRLIDPNNNDNNDDDKTVDFISIPIIIDGVNGESGKNGVNIILSRNNVILEENSNKVINLDNAKTCVYLYDGSQRIDPSNYSVSLSPHGCMASSYIDGNLVYVEITQIAENLNQGYITIIVNYNGTTYSKDFDFYVNRLGSWKEEVIGDTKRAIAESELFDVDENTGEIVQSNALAEYIRSSSQYSVRLTNIENDISSASTEINAVAGEIRATVEGLGKAGITINGDNSTIELNAKNTIVSGDFYAPRIKSIGDGKYSEINGGKFSLGLYKNGELEEDENPFKEYFRINIDSDGNAVLEYLDGNGKVIGQINSSFFENQTVIADSWSPLRAAKITNNSYSSANHKFNYIRNNLNNNLTSSISNYYKYIKGYTKGQETSDDRNGKYFISPNPNSSFMDDGYFLSENTYTTQINRLPQLMQLRIQEDSTHSIPDTNVNSDGSSSTVHYYEVYYVREGQLSIQYVCSDGQVRFSPLIKTPEENFEG